MRKSVIVKRKCQKEGKMTEHYHYPESDKTICAECRRTYRLERYYFNDVARKNDNKYNKKWKERNAKKVELYAEERKLKIQKIRFNFDNAKKDFIVNNITRIQLLHDSYGIPMRTEELMKAIKNINNTTISKIMRDIASHCRKTASKMFHQQTVKNMDKQAIKFL